MKNFLHKKNIFRIFFLKLLILVNFQCSTNRDRSDYITTYVSYYANKFDGKKTANGEVYRHHKMTGAHKNLPYGTKIEIINIKNSKSVIITINDRGPLKSSRELDISQAAFKKLGSLNEGILKVKYRKL